MAFVTVLLSGLTGLIAALIALAGYDTALSQTLLIYLVGSTVPAALIMAGAYIHALVNRQSTPDSKLAKSPYHG
jgi:hypothetical protein